MINIINNYLNINFLNSILLHNISSFIFSFIITFVSINSFIKYNKKKSLTQPIYEYAPKNHQEKQNTPSMGGLVFITTSVITSIIFAKLTNIYVITSILTLLLFATIGFIDDYLKIKNNKNSSGLSKYQKFILLIIFSIVCSSLIFYLSSRGSTIHIPFFNNYTIELSIFIVIFWILVIVSTSNAVNLSDGLDGLVSLPSTVSIITFICIIYLSTQDNNYLKLGKDLLEYTVVASSLIGAILAFLYFNTYPAKIFMGDTGSLAIGAFLAYSAIITKSEILLILIGLIFVIETLSVIMQIYSFRYFNKRIFKMAPLHHHFELSGWSEKKIVKLFWSIAIISNIIAILTII